jgi:NAD-specific glutamate dehydrogenase
MTSNTTSVDTCVYTKSLKEYFEHVMGKDIQEVMKEMLMDHFTSAAREKRDAAYKHVYDNELHVLEKFKRDSAEYQELDNLVSESHDECKIIEHVYEKLQEEIDGMKKQRGHMFQSRFSDGYGVPQKIEKLKRLKRKLKEKYSQRKTVENNLSLINDKLYILMKKRSNLIEPFVPKIRLPTECMFNKYGGFDPESALIVPELETIQTLYNNTKLND